MSVRTSRTKRIEPRLCTRSSSRWRVRLTAVRRRRSRRGAVLLDLLVERRLDVGEALAHAHGVGLR